MRRGALVLAVVAAALAATMAVAQDFKDGLVESGTLTVGTSGSAPPFSMTSATGELGLGDHALGPQLADVVLLALERLLLRCRLLHAGLGQNRGRCER